MAYPSRGLIPLTLQKNYFKLLSPLITLFATWQLTPNVFTFAGLIITSFAAAALVLGYIRLSGLLILAGGFCDSIDGLLARTSGKTSRFGALLDSSIDRYSEFIIFFGIAAYFIGIEDYGTSGGAFLALCGSFMVSYARARAESLGFEAKVGLMQRPERIVLIGLGALIHTDAFKIAIWLVALFANLTALQRIRWAYKQGLKEYKDGAVLKP